MSYRVYIGWQVVDANGLTIDEISTAIGEFDNFNDAFILFNEVDIKEARVIGEFRDYLILDKMPKHGFDVQAIKCIDSVDYDEYGEPNYLGTPLFLSFGEEYKAYTTI